MTAERKLTAQEQAYIFMLRGVVASLTPEEQAQIEAASKDLRDALARHKPEFGAIALALVGAEEAAKP